MIKVNIKKKNFQPFRIYGNNVLVRIKEQEDENFVTCIEQTFSCTNRDKLVSDLIRLKYPSDKMDAVRNNYDLVRDDTAGDKTQEYTEEYLAMQAWRRYAKELANEIFEEYERQHG